MFVRHWTHTCHVTDKFKVRHPRAFRMRYFSSCEEIPRCRRSARGTFLVHVAPSRPVYIIIITDRRFLRVRLANERYYSDVSVSKTIRPPRICVVHCSNGVLFVHRFCFIYLFAILPTPSNRIRAQRERETPYFIFTSLSALYIALRFLVHAYTQFIVLDIIVRTIVCPVNTK